MAESIPVLVVHGISVRDRDAFVQSVAGLESRITRLAKSRYRLVPVYWGDLGGQGTYLKDALPPLLGSDVRAGEAEPTANRELIGAYLDSQMTRSAVGVRSDSVADTIVRSAQGAVSQQVRSTDNPPAIDAGVRDTLPQTKIVQHLRDPTVLDLIGRIVGEAAGISPLNPPTGSTGSYDAGATGSTGSYGNVRGGEDTRAVGERINRIKNAVGSTLKSIDELLGKVVGDVLGVTNQSVRALVAGPVSNTLGDIAAYHHKQRAIQDRLWEAIERHAPGYGRKDTPIPVIAHSLGGVVSFDIAVGDYPNAAARPEQLWIKTLVTFGSQASLFHIMVPRDPPVARYVGGSPVTLPETIMNWVNLWDPMDVLAFTAGAVFRLHDGSVPRDIRVSNAMLELTGHFFWTHSIYWESDQLVGAFCEALG